MIDWLIWKIKRWWKKKSRRTCVHCGSKINYESLIIFKSYHIDFDLLPGEISGDSTDFIADLCGNCFGKFYREYQALLNKYMPLDVKGSSQAQKVIKNPTKYIEAWYEKTNY